MADGENSILEALLSGIQVSKKLGEASSPFPRDVSTLIDLVKSGLSAGGGSYEINFHPRLYQASAFKGTIEAFSDHAHIYYNLDQSRCWRRFIVVKEMCHLLFASIGEKHLASTPAQIEQLIIQILAGIENCAMSDHIANTENCTVFMALEVLLPNSQRKHVEAMVLDGKTHRQVAEHYLVPELMIGLYLSPNYINAMDSTCKLAG